MNLAGEGREYPIPTPNCEPRAMAIHPTAAPGSLSPRAIRLGVGNSTKRPLAGSNRPIYEARLSQKPETAVRASRDDKGPIGRRNLVQNDLDIR
jgi:hypothetical protein